MLGGVILILFIWWLVRNIPNVHAPLYAMSIISALILLAVGLNHHHDSDRCAYLPRWIFICLGQNVTFKNQVLFFSK